MNILQRFGSIAGGILVILFAGYAQGGVDIASDNPPPVASPGTDQFAAPRTASGIDLNSVKCAYVWALAAKMYLDRCTPAGDTELKQDLDYELTATAEFIITNSTHPDAAKQELATMRTRADEALPQSTDDPVCSASADDRNRGALKAYSNALRAIPSNDRRAKVTKLLTVPGPALLMCTP
jgi:hypothetical protein